MAPKALNLSDDKEVSFVVQAFLDTKDLPSVISPVDQLDLPGIFSQNRAYNNWIKDTCDKFGDRLDKEREVLYFDWETSANQYTGKSKRMVITIAFVIGITNGYRDRHLSVLTNETEVAGSLSHVSRIIKKIRNEDGFQERNLLISPTEEGLSVTILCTVNDPLVLWPCALSFACKVIKTCEGNAVIGPRYGDATGKTVKLKAAFDVAVSALALDPNGNFMVTRLNANRLCTAAKKRKWNEICCPNHVAENLRTLEVLQDSGNDEKCLDGFEIVKPTEIFCSKKYGCKCNK